MKSINLKVSEFILLIVIILLISIFIGYKIGRKDTKQVVLDKNLQQFINIYNNINIGVENVQADKVIAIKSNI